MNFVNGREEAGTWQLRTKEEQPMNNNTHIGYFTLKLHISLHLNWWTVLR